MTNEDMPRRTSPPKSEFRSRRDGHETRRLLERRRERARAQQPDFGEACGAGEKELEDRGYHNSGTNRICHQLVEQEVDDLGN